METSIVTDSTLPSGVRVVAEAAPQAQSVALAAWLASGTRHEPAPFNGVAHFLEHMVFKGTARWDARAMAREIEVLGGLFDAYTTHEMTCYVLQVLPAQLDRGLSLLAELLTATVMREEMVELEKRVVLEEILESEDSPPDVLQEIVARQAWGDHPLAWPVLGTRETVAGFTVDSVEAYRHSHYTGARLLLAGAGALDANAFAGQVDAAFEAIPANGQPPREQAPTFTPGVAAERIEVDQIHICLAAPAPAAADEDRSAVWVLDALLGGTMSSRLFQEVREQRGLAYQVSSSWQAMRDTGLMMVEAIAGPRQVTEVLKVTRDAIEAFCSEPVDEEELAWVKEYARATIALGGEAVAAQANRLARSYFYHDRHVSLAESLDAVEALGPADIQRAAQQVFGERQYVLGAAGPVTPKRMETWWKVVQS